MVDTHSSIVPLYLHSVGEVLSIAVTPSFVSPTMMTSPNLSRAGCVECSGGHPIMKSASEYNSEGIDAENRRLIPFSTVTSPDGTCRSWDSAGVAVTDGLCEFDFVLLTTESAISRIEIMVVALKVQAEGNRNLIQKGR